MLRCISQKIQQIAVSNNKILLNPVVNKLQYDFRTYRSKDEKMHYEEYNDKIFPIQQIGEERRPAVSNNNIQLI